MSGRLEVYTVAVSDKTTWIILRLSGEDGEGIGEATVHRHTAPVLDAIPRAVEAVNAGGPGLSHGMRVVREAVGGVAGRAVASAIEQAVLDREGGRTGRPVHALLGGAVRDAVPAYANINRGTLSRSPQEFADRAALAEGEGYGAVKLAPFDGLSPGGGEAERAAAMEAGFARIAAVAGRVGGRVRVQVDCQSSFRPDELGALLARVADLGVVWLEEPTPETPEALPALSALRAEAARRGVALAGAEKVAGADAIGPLLAVRAYDVVMPDIVIAGGPAEVMRIASMAAGEGTQVSPHNPCGPVMDMHSVHVAAAVPRLHSLERQFRESPLYDEIVFDRRHRFEAGRITLCDAPGLGLWLDWDHPALVCRGGYCLGL